MEIFLFVSFITGVISILSPCILPVLPIFIGFNLKKRKSTEIISFVLGLFAIFIIILFATVYFTAAIYRYLNYIRVISALVLLLIGGFLLTSCSCRFPALIYFRIFNFFIMGTMLQRIFNFTFGIACKFGKSCFCSSQHSFVLSWIRINIISSGIYNF